MKLLASGINKSAINNLNKNNISFHWIGFKEPLSKSIVNKLMLLEAETKNNSGMILNLCFNYGGTQDILQAAKKANKTTSLIQFNDLLLTKGTPTVDLLIRTGNEKRISNFLI
jgi:undecaprenyl diphosphate synthase